MNNVSNPPLPARPLALPNLLTYARIAAVPVVVALLYWQSILDGGLWLRWAALAVIGALALQVSIGIFMVLRAFPLELAAAHNAGAALLVGATVLLNRRLRPVADFR